MNCCITFFANKFVGMHVSSVSSFGGKSKAKNIEILWLRKC